MAIFKKEKPKKKKLVRSESSYSNKPVLAKNIYNTQCHNCHHWISDDGYNILYCKSQGEQKIDELKRLPHCAAQYDMKMNPIKENDL